jgi:hypothetical protein
VQGLTLAQISFEKGDLSVVYSTAVFYIEVKNENEKNQQKDFSNFFYTKN